MRSYRSEPFLWIHFAGIAVVPLALQVVGLGLSLGDPLPFFWLELLFLVAVGIVPILWMQWNRPFDIFSLLIIALKPNKLTAEQLKILTLFKLGKQRGLSAIAALVMLVILWQVYRVAPLASIAADSIPFLPQWRVVGLSIAAIGLLTSHLFLQVPVSVLGVLLTRSQIWEKVEPYLPEKIAKDFSVPGFKVDKILPIVEPQAPSTT